MRTDEASYHGDGTTVTVALASLGRPEFDELVEAHPPVAETDLWCEPSFAPALIAASLTSWSVPYADEDPHTLGPIDVATAASWWNEWPVDAAEDLFGRCVALNISSIEWARRRLERDSRLAAEVACSSAHGIAHSVFLSWPERDQDLALASQVIAADRCPGCRVRAAAMNDPAAHTVVSRACVHCEAIKGFEATIPAQERHRYHLHLEPTGNHGEGREA